MPYILAVLIMVFASVGFTFFKVSNNKVIADNSQPFIIEVSATEKSSLDYPQPPHQASSTEQTVSTSKPTAALSSPTPTPTLQTAPSPTPTPAPKPTSTPTPVVVYDYRNGTYSTQNSYRTPGGTYTINVSATIYNDKITNTSVSFSAGGSDNYSKRFSNAYQSTVVGQDLGTVHPSRIGGASLTTRAFNAALDTIRSQAAT